MNRGLVPFGVAKRFQQHADFTAIIGNNEHRFTLFLQQVAAVKSCGLKKVLQNSLWTWEHFGTIEVWTVGDIFTAHLHLTSEIETFVLPLIVS